MEAKDTVMSDRDLLKFELKYSREDTFYWGAAFDAAIKAQAKISFTIGKQEGMKEVVGWIKEHQVENEFSAISIPRFTYLTKLKEWGLEVRKGWR